MVPVDSFSWARSPADESQQDGVTCVVKCCEFTIYMLQGPDMTIAAFHVWLHGVKLTLGRFQKSMDHRYNFLSAADHNF